MALKHKLRLRKSHSNGGFKKTQYSCEEEIGPSCMIA
jgi:hypothetical protein